MDTVTYPDASVQQALGDHAVAARFNIGDPDQQTRTLMRQFRQLWTPTLIFLDHHQIELRRLAGYVPPDEFVAQLDLAIGLAHMYHAQFDKAFEQFRTVEKRDPHPDVGAEALYWAGAAALRRDGNADGLVAQWNELKAKYPTSSWWTRASFINM